MTQQQTRYVVAAILVAALLLMIAITGDGDLGVGPNSPLEGKVERATTHEDGQGVGESTATLLAGGLALLGVVVGLFGDRYFRHRGDILCRSSDWSMTYTSRNYWNTAEIDQPVPFNRGILERERLMELAEYGNYSCSVKLFNETEVATGLRDIKVAFTDDSDATERVLEPQMIEGRGVLSYSAVLNLPARQWVEVTLEGRVETEDFEALARSTTAKLRAWLPKDKPFERPIARLWD